MKIKFISNIKRGNKNGTGFFYIPKDQSNLIRLGDRGEIKFSSRISFFSQIIKHNNRLGVYVPEHLMKKYTLLNKNVEVHLKKVKEFYAPVGSEGRIYIPYDIIQKYRITQNDIILVKAIENNKIIQKKYSKIHLTVRPKRKRLEYICIFNRNLKGRTFLFQIEKQKISEIGITSMVAEFLRDTHYASITKKSVIIFRGNKIPAIINTNLNYTKLAFYLGAYFADGTKKGNSWAICASTFEQARYYLKMHNLLVKDSKNPEFAISYTNINNTDENILRERLAEIWRKRTGVQVNKFRIRKPTGKLFAKWNQYGTLIIREHKQILLDFYNALLNSLIKEILSKRDKKLAIDFICGVMEGDGCASAQQMGGIIISTNKNDVYILRNILKVAQIKFNVTREGKNKYTLRIGALEVLRNFHFLKNKIFDLYPKRKKRFLERLNTVGAIKFLTENHEPTNWIKQWLKNNGFSNENNRITQKGLRFRSFLLDEVNKV